MSDSEDEFINYPNKPTHDEIMKELDDLQNHPLFATTDHQLAKDSNENEALRSLLYDEDKEVLAENFYIQANKILTSKVLSKDAKEDEIQYYLKQAEKKYNEAISQNSNDKILQSKLYCNLGLVHFKLKNYGRCSQLCDKAIKLNPQYVKAFYRKAQCQFELKKYKECLEVCEQALQVENQSVIINLKKKVKKLYQKELRKERDKQIIKSMKLEQIIEYLNQKNILYSVVPTLQLPEIYKREFNLKNQKIESSIVFLYPEFGQFDFVQTSQQDHLVWDYFKHIFSQGLPWDTNNKYKLYQIELYVELYSQYPLNDPNFEKKNKKIKKIPKKISLIELMQYKGYVIPKCLEIIVVCVASDYYKFFLDKYKEQLYQLKILLIQINNVSEIRQRKLFKWSFKRC